MPFRKRHFQMRSLSKKAGMISYHVGPVVIIVSAVIIVSVLIIVSI